MRQLRTLWLFLVLLAVPASVWAQATTGSIAGRVTEEATGAPVAGAQVFLSGTTRGIVTNQQGQFLLTNIPAGPHEVAVSLIGFAQAAQRVTVTPGQTANANFTLKQSAVELGAVVVTASGQQQRTQIGRASCR